MPPRGIKYSLIVFLFIVGWSFVWVAFYENQAVSADPVTPEYILVPLPTVPASTTTPEVVTDPVIDAEEVVIELPVATTTPDVMVEPDPVGPQLPYIMVSDSCGYNFADDCVVVRSGPGLSFPVVATLRNGMVLRIAEMEAIEADGHLWYKIIFDEWIRYPGRISKEWYVAADYVTRFTDVGLLEISTSTPATNKRIVVDRSGQTLIAYDGDEVFMSTTISTGRDVTPTPRGTFTVFKKTPSRYMQGPLPGVSTKYYDLPGVPWNLYFTEQGAVVHGAYWHESYGSQYSNGCVNIEPSEARTLYQWADLGMTVTVVD
jgi:hypothetical protein